MAYIKTNWINGVTPMDDINLNKIEAGIFNTELKADAYTSSKALTGWRESPDGFIQQWGTVAVTNVAEVTKATTVTFQKPFVSLCCHIDVSTDSSYPQIQTNSQSSTTTTFVLNMLRPDASTTTCTWFASGW